MYSVSAGKRGAFENPSGSVGDVEILDFDDAIGLIGQWRPSHDFDAGIGGIEAQLGRSGEGGSGDREFAVALLDRRIGQGDAVKRRSIERRGVTVGA